MEDLANWLLMSQYGSYISAFFVIVGALVTAASAIVPFTKTPKDDEIVSKVKAVLARFSVFNPKP